MSLSVSLSPPLSSSLLSVYVSLSVYLSCCLWAGQSGAQSPPGPLLLPRAKIVSYIRQSRPDNIQVVVKVFKAFSVFPARRGKNCKIVEDFSGAESPPGPPARPSQNPSFPACDCLIRHLASPHAHPRPYSLDPGPERWWGGGVVEKERDGGRAGGRERERESESDIQGAESPPGPPALHHENSGGSGMIAGSNAFDLHQRRNAFLPSSRFRAKRGKP